MLRKQQDYKMIIQASVLASLAFMASPSKASSFPVIPGICTETTFGVGCAINRINQTISGLNFQATFPVVEFTYCDSSCYTIPFPNSTVNCPTYCYAMYGSQVYAVPTNVLYMPIDEDIVCYDVETSETIDQYQTEVSNTYTHNGFFSSSSTTVIHGTLSKYEEDTSIFFMTEQRLFWNLAIPTFIPSWFQPTQDFLAAAEYYLRGDYNYQQMKQFIDIYGTDVLVNTGLGGLVQFQSFFHECFMSVYSYTEVTSQGSDFFFKHWQSGTDSGSTTSTFIDWSYNFIFAHGGNLSLVNIGGFETMNQTEIQAWADSVINNPVPIIFQVVPLTMLLSDQELINNLNQTISDYMTESNINNTNLIEQLQPKDPSCIPSWCEIDGKPGTCNAMAQINYIPNQVPGWFDNTGYTRPLSSRENTNVNTTQHKHLSDLPSCPEPATQAQLEAEIAKRI